jgi:hypothetical protein
MASLRFYVKDISTRLRASSLYLLHSFYFWCNLGHLLYAILFVLINTSSLERYSFYGYVCVGILRVINAYMYMFSWDRSNWTNLYLIPEYLYILSALVLLYATVLFGSNMYVYSPNYNSAIRMSIFGWGIYTLAAIGWIFSWYFDYLERFGQKVSLFFVMHY